MTDESAPLEPPHRNGDSPHPPAERAGRPPWEFMILALFIALICIAIILGWILFGSNSPERLDAGAAGSIDAACREAQTELAALPDLEPRGGAAVVARIRAENRVLRRMVAEIGTVRPADETQAAALRDWSADWAAVVAARENFTERLETEKRAKFVLPAETGSLKPVTGRMDDYVRQSHPMMDACLTESLRVEVVDTPRSYPDAESKE